MNHATIAIVSDADTLSAEARERLSEYLKRFLEPIIAEKSIECPCCGAGVYYGGGVMDALLATFEWGIAHGEGKCGRCKWPIRMYHFVQLDGPEKRRFVYPLAHICYADEAHETEIDPKEYWAKRRETEFA